MVVARDEGEQARSVIMLPREPGFALAQFVFAEAEAPAATVGDEERIRRNIERRSSRRWFRAVTDALDENRGGSMLEVAHAFDIEAVKERLRSRPLLPRPRDRRLRPRRARARPSAAARRRRGLRRSRRPGRTRRRRERGSTARRARALRAGGRRAPLQRLRGAEPARDLRAQASPSFVSLPEQELRPSHSTSRERPRAK